MKEEWWDLFDASRRPTGEVILRGTPIPAGRYRLVVHLCLFNSKGQMLIQKRQKDKRGWPDMWDVSLGGHAVSGETSQQTVMREAREELGLTLEMRGQAPAVCTSFPDGFDDIYTMVKDISLSDLVLQEEEVACVRWAKKEEILSMMREGTFIPYHKGLLELEFYLRNHPQARMDRALQPI